MSTKKRKPLGSAIQEFVFATKEALPAPTPTELPPPAPTPTASAPLTPPTPPTPFALLPTATPPGPRASVPHPVPIQSKEPSLMSKLQVPDKEATVRFSVDMPESVHRKLSMLGAFDRAQESGLECRCCWRMG